MIMSVAQNILFLVVGWLVGSKLEQMWKEVESASKIRVSLLWDDGYSRLLLGISMHLLHYMAAIMKYWQ